MLNNKRARINSGPFVICRCDPYRRTNRTECKITTKKVQALIDASESPQAGRMLFLFHPDEYDAEGKPVPHKLHRDGMGRFLPGDHAKSASD
jgi:hypothetical protein